MTVIDMMNYNYENKDKKMMNDIMKGTIKASLENGSFNNMREYFKMFGDLKIADYVSKIEEQYGLNENVEEHVRTL